MKQSSSESCPKSCRVLKRREFLQIQGSDKRYHSQHFLMAYCKKTAGEEQLFPRIGITVTKKVHKLAVYRNKIKRLVREVYRKNKHLLNKNYDFVIIAKSDATELTYAQVEKELFFIWQRTRLLKDHKCKN